MGVRGFLSYIKKFYEFTLEDQYLRNCILIVDGRNVANNLFTDFMSNLKYGGDYYGFDVKVREFFSNLLKCNIVPMVIIKGCQDERKFKRTLDKFTTNCEHCSLTNFSDYPWLFSSFSHIFALDVFTEVLIDMEIKYCQIDGEGDDEIIHLANKFDGYVLSNNSDFCFFNVKFVWMSYLSYQEPHEILRNDCQKYYTLRCKSFNKNMFSHVTGVNIDFIPLLPVLVESEFSIGNNMESFLKNAAREIRKGIRNIESPHQRMDIVISWLRKQNGNQSSVFKKILSISDLTQLEEKTLKEALDMFIPRTTDILPFFEDHEPSCHIERLSLKDQSSEKSYGNVPCSIKNLFRCICTDENTIYGIKNLPKKFVSCYRYNLLDNKFLISINRDYMFFGSMVEDSTKESINIPLLGILRNCQAILVKSLKESFARDKINQLHNSSKNLLFGKYKNFESLSEFSFYIRKDNKPFKHIIPKENLSLYSHLPTLYEIQNMTAMETKAVFLKILKLNFDFSDKVPSSINYILLIISFWYKNYDISTNVLSSTFLTFIVLFLSDYKSIEYLSGENFDNSFFSLVNKVTKDNCQNLSSNIEHFTKGDPETFDLSVTHSLSCYQSTIKEINFLNATLGFPFPVTSICRLWSGKICYNLYLIYASSISKDNIPKDILGIDSFCDIYKYFENVLYKSLYICRM